MLIALIGIYCTVATVVALGLLRGGACRREEPVSRAGPVPEGECCPQCRSAPSGTEPAALAGLRLRHRA